MNQLIQPLRTIAALALLTFGIGCATTETHSPDMLVSAGFRPFTADTPQKKELLKSLQADHISLITWKGKNLYVQPDVPNNRAFVGTPEHFQSYQGLRREKQMRNDDLLAAQMDRAQMAHWGAWGPGMYNGIYGRRF